MISLLVVLGTIVAVSVLSVVLLLDGHPENGCSHGDHPKETESERFYNQADRPAGPDAEDASLECDPPPPRRRKSRRRQLFQLGSQNR
jgi:hypothetical protein